MSFLLNLGPSIFLPIMIFIIAIFARMPLKKAIKSALIIGVAFEGMSLVLEFMFNTISPVAIKFVENTGFSLSTVDIGWAPMAAISFAWPYALIIFPMQIIINILMLAFNKTNVLNIDILNVWGKIFTAILVYYASSSLILSFLFAAIQVVLELKTADVMQKRIELMTGIKAVSCTNVMVVQTSLMYPISKLLDKIGIIKNVKLDKKSLEKKIGIFSEDAVMGFLIGMFLAILAGYNIENILKVSIKTACALVMFPIIAKLFIESLTPLAEAISKFIEKKYKNKNVYIGLDWSILAGQSEIWIVSILLIPITLILALILSKLGLNTVLPLGGIINIPIVVASLLVANKNLIKMLILTTLFTPAYLICSSLFASDITKAITSIGIVNVPKAQLVTYYCTESPILRKLFIEASKLNIFAFIFLALFILNYIYFYKKNKF